MSSLLYIFLWIPHLLSIRVCLYCLATPETSMPSMPSALDLGSKTVDLVVAVRSSIPRSIWCQHSSGIVSDVGEIGERSVFLPSYLGGRLYRPETCQLLSSQVRRRAF